MAIIEADNIGPIKSEKIPGWVFIEKDRFIARLHGNVFWSIQGKVDEIFPTDELLLDPVFMTLNVPEDFAGKFNGTIGRGEISLTWEKSGAMITGRSHFGDVEVHGETIVRY